LNERIGMLRKLEEYGYSIAYYLLQNEELAVEATRAALIEASGDFELSGLPGRAQKEKFGKLALSKAILVRRESLIGKA